MAQFAGLNPFKSFRRGAQPETALLPAQGWLKASQIMSAPVVQIRQTERVAAAIGIMADHAISCVVVKDGRGRPAGMLTERDIVTRVIGRGRDPNRASVRTVMSKPLAGIAPQANVLTVVRRMKERGFRRIAVLVKNRVVGMLTETDILAALISPGVSELVRSAAVRSVVTVSPACPTRRAARIMADRGISSLIVRRGRKIVGILTERCMAIRAGRADSGRVADVMTTPVVHVPPDASLFTAERVMRRRRIRQLVVMSRGRVMGVLSQGDMLRQLSASMNVLDTSIRRSLNTHPNPVLLADRRGRLIYANRAYSRFIERSDLSALVGRPVMPPAMWANPGNRAEIFRNVRKFGLSEQRDLRFRTEKGAARIADMIVVDISPAGGRPSGFRIILRDKTEEGRLQQRILEISDSEMRRFGRELHDCLGQNLTAIALQCGLLERRVRSGAARPEDVSRIKDLANLTIAKTRNLSQILFPLSTHPATLGNLIKRVAVDCRSLFGVDIRVRIDDDGSINRTYVATHIFRIIQESITNAVRHGSARRVDIRLSKRKSRRVLTIEDDGRGLKSPAEGGLGITLMKYRAGQIGAALQILPRRPRGAKIICSMPVSFLTAS